MAKLYLVRHAQASFGMENYDRLSDWGVKQSAFIPKHFENINISARYRGDMQRHKQTAEHAFGDSPFTELPGLNEFNHIDVLTVHRPEINDRDQAMALIAAQPDPMRFMEEEFEKAMLRWMNEEGTTSYKEPFKVFKERSLAAIHQIVATARKEKQKEVVAITSGGFISLIVSHLLNVPGKGMVDLNLNIANGGVTALLFNDHKISLGYYNNYSHLPADMVTFR